MFLTDPQWTLLQPLFSAPPSTSPRGRPPIDDRLILDAILWKLTAGIPWDLLPASFPSSAACYRRYRLWKHSGLLRHLLALLYRDLVERGGFDPQLAIDQGLVQIGVYPGVLSQGRLGRRWAIYFHPSLKGAWQMRTARLLFAVALHQIHVKPI